MSTDTDTLVRPVEQTRVGSGPADVAHIIMDGNRERDEPHTAYLEALVEGLPLTALCGHVFVPSKDAKSLPVCEPCKAIYEHDPLGHGDRGELPDV